MIWITVATFGSLALMFEAGRRWGDMRHHHTCHETPTIPIDWQAAVDALRGWIDKSAERQESVDGFQVVHDILDAAFPGMIKPLDMQSMTPDEAADILEGVVPGFDRDLFRAEVARYTQLIEEQLAEETDAERFLNGLDQDPGADETYRGSG